MSDSSVELPKKGSPLDWAARVALMTVGLYAAVISFEVGYFWKLGGSMMAIFSPTEHAVHAVGKLGIFLVLAVAILSAMTYPHLVLDLYTKKAVAVEEPEGSSGTVPSWKRAATTIPFLLILTWSASEVLPSMYKEDGMSPLFICGVIAILLMMAHAIENILNRNRKSYRLLAVPLIGLALPAMGSAAYSAAINPNNATLITIGPASKQKTGYLIFSGSSKVLYKMGDAIFLEDYEDKFRRQITTK